MEERETEKKLCVTQVKVGNKKREREILMGKGFLRTSSPASSSPHSNPAHTMNGVSKIGRDAASKKMLSLWGWGRWVSPTTNAKCKMEAQLEYGTCCVHVFLYTFGPDSYAQSVLINKMSVRVRCWLGQ